MSRMVKDIKLSIRRLKNKFNRVQDEIDELRWELASTQKNEKRIELRNKIEKIEKK